jgi:hypothetical protein
MNNEKAALRFLMFIVLIVLLTGCETKAPDLRESNSEIVSDERQAEEPEPEAVKNTCTICERQFEGLGYQEVTEGVWEPCEYPYQCFICSPACGMKHTRGMNNLMERVGAEGQRNDGRIYETDACTLCKGTGIEKNTAQDVFGGPDGRKCPMCDGRGVMSY